MLKRLPPQLREAGVIFLITRGTLFLLAPLAYLTLPKIEPEEQLMPPLVDPGLTETLGGFWHYLIDIWARWDAVWFLQIAEYGYSPVDGSAAFFPLYPLLIAAFKPLFFGNGVLAGIFISLACCLAAFYFLYRLVELDFNRGVARRAVFYLAIFPTSFFFQTIYSESLFLLLTIGCFYLARRREYALAGSLGALATLTRSAGILLLVPLAIMYMQDRQWKWRQIRFDALYLLLVPLGLGVWMLYLGLRFDDPLLFSSAQSNWLRGLTFPLEGFRQGLMEALYGIDTIISSPDRSYLPRMDADMKLWATYNVINFGFALAFLGLCVAAFWRLPLAWSAYALAILLLPLSTPSTYVPLFSMPRFMLAAFPLFVLLALWGEKREWADRLVTVSFLTLLGLFTAKFVVWTWIA